MNANIATLETPYLNSAFNLPSAHPQAVRNKLISDLAKSCLAEFAMSVAITGVTSLFVVTSTGMSTLLVTALAVGAINTVIKTIIAYLQYRIFQLQDGHRRENLRAIVEGHNWTTAAVFTYLDRTTRSVLTHEVGHAAAASLLYHNANPTIEIFPMEGGVTRYYPSVLSKIGKYLGKKNADLFVTAAGSGASILFATGSLILASHIKKSHPQLHRYLVATAVMSIVQETFYAITALWTPKKHLSHDFVALWRHGIHPVVSAIAMVAVPILGLAAFGKKSQPSHHSVRLLTSAAS